MANHLQTRVPAEWVISSTDQAIRRGSWTTIQTPASSVARGDRVVPPLSNCGVCEECKLRNQPGSLTSSSHDHFSLEFGRILRSGRRFLRDSVHGWRVLQDGFTELFTAASRVDIQKEAVIRWQDHQQRHGLTIDFNKATELKHVFNMIDDYLFRGTLKGSKKLIWVDYDPTNPELLGQTYLDEDAPDTRVVIEITRTPNPGEHGEHPHDDPSEVIDTLLHEMCHAVFELYTCQYCCTASGPGFTGHGPAWLSLCHAVQESLRMSFAGFENFEFAIADDSSSVQEELEALEEHGLWTVRRQLRRQALAYQNKPVH